MRAPVHARLSDATTPQVAREMAARLEVELAGFEEKARITRMALSVLWGHQYDQWAIDNARAMAALLSDAPLGGQDEGVEADGESG